MTTRVRRSWKTLFTRTWAAARRALGRWRQRPVSVGDMLPPAVAVAEDSALGTVLLLRPTAEPRAGATAPAAQSTTTSSPSEERWERLNVSQRLETLGRLTSGVAHDFNNLLTVILGNSEMLIECLGGDDPVRVNLVKEIQKAADQGAALTAQLLAFGRKQAAAPRRLDLGHTVEDAAMILGRLIGKSVRLVVRAKPGLAAVNADPVRIHQVILNLALNARDAMPKGGTLTIETANAMIERADGAVAAGAYVVLSVSDTGCGMDAHTQAHLFEPFFTTKAPGQGTGLGLSIIADIVRQAGGAVEVASTPGQGTTFRVYLPQAAEAASHRVA